MHVKYYYMRELEYGFYACTSLYARNFTLSWEGSSTATESEPKFVNEKKKNMGWPPGGGIFQVLSCITVTVWAGTYTKW